MVVLTAISISIQGWGFWISADALKAENWGLFGFEVQQQATVVLNGYQSDLLQTELQGTNNLRGLQEKERSGKRLSWCHGYLLRQPSTAFPSSWILLLMLKTRSYAKDLPYSTYCIMSMSSYPDWPGNTRKQVVFLDKYALTITASVCRSGHMMNLIMILYGPIKQRKQDQVCIASG